MAGEPSIKSLTTYTCNQQQALLYLKLLVNCPALEGIFNLVLGRDEKVSSETAITLTPMSNLNFTVFLFKMTVVCH